MFLVQCRSRFERLEGPTGLTNENKDTADTLVERKVSVYFVGSGICFM